MSDDSTTPIVCLTQVHKRRGDRQALADVTFAIPRGSVFGLIGPNGAGKTTVLKLLLGMLRPDQGRVEVLGSPPMELSPAARQRIGYLSERAGGFEIVGGSAEPSLMPRLTVGELLEHHSLYFAAFDWSWSRGLLERLQLRPEQDPAALSEGERRKVDLLLALAHRPELLVLDDPMLGLDARARRELLWTTLAAARDDGTTIVFTSHVLHDVERMVDRVLILDRGRVRLEGELDDVLARTRRLVFADCGDLPAVPGEARRTRHGRDLAVVTTSFDEGLEQRLRGGHPTLQVEPLNLEEIFCAVIADTEPKS